MKTKRWTALALILGLCFLLAAPALAVEYGVVQGGWLRLRANPTYDATVVASYRNGTVVTVMSRENGWARVLTPDYRIGYMDARYLYFGPVPAPTPVPTPVPTYQPTRTWTEVNRTAWVTSPNGKGVRMRSAPEVTKTNVLGLYPVGRTVTEIRVSSDGWSYVRIDRKHGYMMSRYLTTGQRPLYPTVTPQPWYPVVTGYPWSTYVPTPSPTPESKSITQVKLDPYQPKVGDTLRVLVTPSGAEYTAVWYRDDNILLSTGLTYTAQAGDAGHRINVRIQGVGASAGFAADAMSAPVKTVP